MKHWEALSDEASIVVLGNFNPKIFHPEWFIRKELVDDWNYEEDDNIVVLSDMAQFSFPDQLALVVLSNKYQLKSSLASNYSSLSDLASSTFDILAETPAASMGMNYHSTIEIPHYDDWKAFGEHLAPPQAWITAAGFIGDLDHEKQQELGLWDMTMNLPRKDDLTGFIRARICVDSTTRARRIRFSTNNHVELSEAGAKDIPSILTNHWDESLRIAKHLETNLMDTILGGKK
jgi:hypothetical protein